MRAGERLAGKLRYGLISHSRIRPRIKYGAGSAGSFSQGEKEKPACLYSIQPQTDYL